jgi:hypothetical protein
VSTSLARLSFTMVVLGVAAGVTLILGVIGLYWRHRLRRDVANSRARRSSRARRTATRHRRDGDHTRTDAEWSGHCSWASCS